MKKNYFFLFLICFVFINLPVTAQRNAKTQYGNNYQRVSCGSMRTLEIRGGTLWSWGQNNYGQGDGTTTNKINPIQ